MVRIFCIGRNYAEHVRELSNVVPQKPVVFMKPGSCLVGSGETIRFPKHGHDLQHEVEVVIRIGKPGRIETKEDALSWIDAVTIGLDLTLRDVQDELKKRGLPWEKSKAFDQSAPIGEFVPCDGTIDLNNLSFTCRVNGVERQRGSTRDMIFSFETLLVEVSAIWSLRPGDLIFTGTPSGVGALAVGDTVEIHGERIGTFSWKIMA
jgi:2-keto-4-pentenoate hydratase/2-oxohepta-3-ene-1,7-dioic acid hydratase in catechol pathway